VVKMADAWVTCLDMCASNGILNYDGAAFLHDTPPRYAGSPQFPVYPQPLPPTNIRPAGPPAVDTFTPYNRDDSLIKNPSWKKILFAVVAGTALIYGGYRLHNSKLAPIKWCKKQLTNVWDWIKKPFTKKKP